MHTEDLLLAQEEDLLVQEEYLLCAYTSKIHDIGHEPGPRGSRRAHIKSGRSYGLQEAF
jgi:hypothetical protein